MDDDERIIRLWSDAELAVATGLIVVLILLPTVIWLAVVMLRRRR
ncbi:hypothetical protein [Nonomuraea gerenzanensis]|uniref:Uncharacterized protein n=1 Tax=Nonomuraea gerenzanensis TaxID=93944 RepID=A0A1M4DYN1_9ACTN|nr:hypothetical protein [Nonomuraea gerenzanensis]SBO91686.1 hypothetical protein BN4615_P1200 [Nonomuraea gerenzanensis]